MRIVRLIALALLVVTFLALFGNPRGPTARANGADIALVGAKIYTAPDEAPITDGTVVVHAGKIAAVGKTGEISFSSGAKIIPCTGKTITAGFQNSHVHFTEPEKWMDSANIPANTLTERFQAMLTRYGFTTVVDTGSLLPNTVEIRRRVESGEVVGPRILTAGAPLYPPNGVPYYIKDSVPPEILKILPQPETPEAAVGVVDSDLDGGADIIKLFTGSWVERGKVKPMPVEVAKAAVEEAHRRGVLVFTHPSNVPGLEVALEAHLDVLAHSIEELDGWNSSYIERMKKANMAMIPTLKLFGEDSDLPKILEEVVSYRHAGGQILFGTDVGYLTDYDPSKEYELMQRAGLTPMQILESLTTAPAARFGESKKRGRVAVGMDADLVVLMGDPNVDARNFAKACVTLRGGRIIYDGEGGSITTGGITFSVCQ
jgi:imidazolonepropionase-like amidohydrolase